MGDVNAVNPKHYTTSRKTYIVALTLEMDMSKELLEKFTLIMFHVCLEMVPNICIFKKSSINNKSKSNKFETYIFLKENV